MPQSNDMMRESRATALLNVKSRLTLMTTAEVNRMAYKDMKNSLYLVGTLGFYMVVIVGSIYIPTVTTVFDFVAAFAISAIAFGFPGLFYLKGAKRFGKPSLYYTRMSYLFITIGCVNCVLGLSSTVLNIVVGSEGGH